MIGAAFDGTFDGWRARARALLAAGIAPEEVPWEGAGQGALPLLAACEPAGRAPPPARAVAVPRAFLAAARRAAHHSDPARWALLYRVLWRVARGEVGLLGPTADPDGLSLERLLREVRADVHRVHALARFRPVREHDGGERWVAWHRPDHRVVGLAAPFFTRRFASMRWSLLSPDESAHWDGRALALGPGVAAPPPADGEDDAPWRAYYASTFNPARANPRLLRQLLPERFHATLPEAREIPALLRAAAPEVQRMIAAPASASAPLARAAGGSLAALAAACARCDACPLHRAATRAVFGEGPANARLVLVGEQPGDEEDRAGRPFVGPAGAVLDEALAGAGLRRGALYVTNAVKHFKFEPRGKRRIHQAPDAREAAACRGWLDAELAAIRPRAVLALGATAARALLGPRFSVSRDRGRAFATRAAPHVLATWHPAAVLRADDAARARMRDELVRDLAAAAALAV